MICRRFSKSSAYTSLFPLNLFKDGNVSGDFQNHPIEITFLTQSL
ncbi:hypothetical protein T4B_13676 [Trichinella pseudospiralis]|uniref:Uncharacterized protein n=1 Tax=Trichinella pseudospiralis TaxID=6337 RepID=A0A0V1GFI7_TRIPS|nr:hypothetical protein T4A_4876 [Trichinella pseudospiralis]KRY97018.1 hypothetical protein T4B_13676 [Trichinella pseudospiralis]